MGGVDDDADRGDLEMVADPGQHMESLFCGHLFGRKGAADIGRVDGSVPQPSQIHLIVTGTPHDAVQVFVGVQTVLAHDDPGERARAGRTGRARLTAAPKVRHGLHFGVAEKPEQRMVGAEADRGPIDPVFEPRHQGPAQADDRAAT